MHRSIEEVARDHLDAVESGDVVAMAADYAADAVLVRGDDTFGGHAQIAEYFASVPERLGSARVVFDSLLVDGDTAIFRWHLEGTPTPVSGTDVCQIANDKIVHQVVHLDATDF